jgi:hypothetical protein
MTLSLGPLLLDEFTNFMLFLTIIGGPALSITAWIERMPLRSIWLAIEVALGVREWNLGARSRPSGGLES